MEVLERPRGFDMMRNVLAVLIGLSMIAAACGSSDPQTEPTTSSPATSDSAEAAVQDSGLPTRIANRGDSSEGHTPRTFAGSGTGLFAGDNLNPHFPADAGIQILLTFDLPAGVTVPTSAVLRSDALTERGDAFDSLGSLQAEPVVYQDFGPPLFNLEAAGPATVCERVGANGIQCDVTDAAIAAVEAEQSTVQLRVQFETMSDGDGQQDLALFFLSDSNTNEPGIFFLELS